jgi:hypothetical protein
MTDSISEEPGTSIFRVEDEERDNRLFRNVGIYLPNCKASHPRTL